MELSPDQAAIDRWKRLVNEPEFRADQLRFLYFNDATFHHVSRELDQIPQLDEQGRLVLTIILLIENRRAIQNLLLNALS